MTPADRDELKRVAEVENIDVADIVRVALADYMSERSITFTGKVADGDKNKRPNAGRKRGSKDSEPRKRRAS
jgi:hypothetical protein